MGWYSFAMVVRTKIIATIGPATGSTEMIHRLVQAGCDAFRVNFSHGSEEQREQFLGNVRSVEAEMDQALAVIADLCGPKIRVGPVVDGSVLLVEGQQFVIQREAIEGNANRISTTLAELVDRAEPGQTILLDDGKLRLEVIEAAPPDELLCRVAVGGVLASGKGVNLPHTSLPLSALTEKDHADLAWIVERDFDYVALSFVQRAEDVEALRAILDDADCRARIIAKIEKSQAIEHIEAIVASADAVMVARGDLGVEMDLPAVPVAQKKIAHICQMAGKCCIIATQMLESMTDSPTPTRAEVSDVANAVLDHADAVMLSGETAVGKYPVEAVTVMNKTAAHIQAYHDRTTERSLITCKLGATLAAVASAVGEIIAVDDIVAVAAFTISGATALMLAKSRLPVPILALAPDMTAVRRMCLYYGVHPVNAGAPEHTRDVLEIASRFVLEQKTASVGEKIVVISGRPIGEAGSANTIVIQTVR